jgi:hypothetical protein
MNDRDYPAVASMSCTLAPLEQMDHNHGVLSHSLDHFNQEIGDFVHRFLKDAPWLRRRVETVSFMDVDTISRRTTVDIDVAELSKAVKNCPMKHGKFPLVPIAILRKDLLVDFNLRDRLGGALAVAPRSIGTYFAWSALCVAARDVLSEPLDDRSPAVMQRLREIAYEFPKSSDDPHDDFLYSWEKPNTWNANDNETWQELIRNEGFSRLLREFTFNFILLTQVGTESKIQIVKFSYQQFLPFTELWIRERLGLRATELSVFAPGVGWAGSYHLRFEAPAEIVLTEVGLYRMQRQPVRSPGPAESYLARIGSETAQVYTNSMIEPAEHVVAVSMRVPIVGYLRAMWLTSLAMAAVLLAGRNFISRLESAAIERSDAAITLLLVAPSLVIAYLVRPDEHAIASRLLRPIRFGLLGVACLSYIGAATLILGWRGSVLATVWSIVSAASLIIAAAITLVVHLTKADLNEATGHTGTTEERRLLVVDYEAD